MNKLCVAIAALAVVGCESYPEKTESDQIREDVTDLKLKVEKNNTGQSYAVEQLVNANKGLVERVTQLEILVRGLETTVRHQDEQLKTLAATRAVAPAPAVPGGPNPPAVPAKKLEDILLEVETTVGQLRDGKLAAAEAATLLKPHARHAIPRLIEELDRSLTRFDYAKKLEKTLASMPAADLKLPLREALQRRSTREAAARVVGQTKDRELSKILEEHADSPDEDFRLAVGEALVLCRNAAGIPALVASLKSEQGTNRTIAGSALKKANRGEDFDFKPQLSPAENAPAIKSWEEWAEKFGKALFD
ncbi:MAG TPA: HEAT repeat domain-containing protein [Planctomycetota bacterium]